MPNSLRSTITDLATHFAASVLDALRQMSLDEILAETNNGARQVAPRAAAPAKAAAPAPQARKPKGRLGRRTSADIATVVAKIVSVLESAPMGLRSEQIRDRLRLASKEMPRPLTEALAKGLVRKVGEKRATTYFSKSAKAAAPKAAPANAKPKAKAGKAAKAKKAAPKSAPAASA